ncbi:soluble scavenger receptor cysteine-rich domain-containing protein SSC5D-like [Micropterus salmoides]|uniref:soluble scavenger receptor cysteine-rich domain-containing protein SSC5D-like n=1 Tax=Micropterus salmoides TaxID=27706 RepID=UPI0018EC9A5B|nr:soluble scavenger receptor cysteine-rich domain-containing protein SSC5D-like [Micropterus salmoides]
MNLLGCGIEDGRVEKAHKNLRSHQLGASTASCTPCAASPPPAQKKKEQLLLTSPAFALSSPSSSSLLPQERGAPHPASQSELGSTFSITSSQFPSGIATTSKAPPSLPLSPSLSASSNIRHSGREEEGNEMD